MQEAARDPSAPDSRQAPGIEHALPVIATALPALEILQRLTNASRRGRLAGFEPKPAAGGLFAAAAHGHPFDSLLVGDHDAAAGRIRFRLVLLRKFPAIFAAILALTIWPGVYCMDELVSQVGLWRPEHPWLTYYWYLPLTVVPIPWIWRSVMVKSRRSAREHAGETIEAIAQAIGGKVE